MPRSPTAPADAPPFALDHALPPFPGFRREGLAFLRSLKRNNDRAWFQPRKAVYEDELLWPMRCLVAQLSRDLPARGVPLWGDPARAVFRIYRDTRFSKNKNPYKTHVGAYLTRSGDRHEDGGLYVHVEPGRSFVGGGFWSPEPTLLRRWRARLAEAPTEFVDVAAALEEAGLEVERQDPLTRMPRGYEAHVDSPVADYLKARGLFATRAASDAEIADPTFAEQAVETALALRPLLDWGWALMDDLR